MIILSSIQFEYAQNLCPSQRLQEVILIKYELMKLWKAGQGQQTGRLKSRDIASAKNN